MGSTSVAHFLRDRTTDIEFKSRLLEEPKGLPMRQEASDIFSTR